MRREHGKQRTYLFAKLILVMAKRASVSNKKKTTKKFSPKKPQEIFPNEISKEPKNPFDFGGLPIRDLKKNLGCG